MRARHRAGASLAAAAVDGEKTARRLLAHRVEEGHELHHRGRRVVLDVVLDHLARLEALGRVGQLGAAVDDRVPATKGGVTSTGYRGLGD